MSHGSDTSTDPSARGSGRGARPELCIWRDRRRVCARLSRFRVAGAEWRLARIPNGRAGRAARGCSGYCHVAARGRPIVARSGGTSQAMVARDAMARSASSRQHIKRETRFEESGLSFLTAVYYWYYAVMGKIVHEVRNALLPGKHVCTRIPLILTLEGQINLAIRLNPNVLERNNYRCHQPAFVS
jgi:hypothetical protein